MSGTPQTELYRRALAALRETRARLAVLEERENRRNDPIAVIGMGCRFPGGVTTPEAFWHLLEHGTDAVGEVPADRWDSAALFDADPAASGKTYSRHGGFLSGIDRFDADFFGIAPREAASIDPQQRLLLEVAWEALEDAGLPPPRLAGSRTGVYVGICSDDYFRMAAADHQAIDAWLSSGAVHSVAAGRISYTLGLNGPAMAVDTACSSSLVAVHEACQALRAGECDLALAGGVNLVLTPELTLNFSRARMLSASGHCHAFDAAADGFVRGEGAGVVVLKPLSRAVADGDPVLAVIRGGAVNQDGRTSGLTVPSGPAQAALMREALARAGVSPHAVGYVEAHGTGTSLGDPIEAGALGDVFFGREQPLRIGSVKANIGHLESAAGIAGLMKVILSLRHGTIPRQVHFHDPNPHIDWASLPLRVPVQAEAWPEGERIAGVSSFGFSGTNAHLVVSEAPPLPMAPRPPDVAGVLVLSGRGEAALRAQAEQWAAWLTGNPDADTHAVRRMAALGRAAFADRLAVVGTTAADLASGLSRFVAEGEGLTGRASGAPPKIGFLFSGQGAQWSGMGRDLYQREPMFRAVLDRCAAAVAGELDEPLLETMFAGGAALDRTDRTQPALYALSCGLAALWRSWGIEPVAVLGHSIGAFAAAHVAGVFDLETGARLVARRGRLMRDLPGDGAMVAVEASEAQVRAALAGYEALVSLAAVNGPLSCVVSGDRQAVAAVCAALPGVRQHPLTVSHAFHSPQMGPMLADFAVAFDGLALAPPTDVAFVSDLSGEVAGTEICEPTYWARHVRAPVRFADGLARMAALGCDALVEIGPRRSLLGLARQADYSGSLLASLRGPEDTGRTILESLGHLWSLGAPVVWERMFGDGAGTPAVRPAVPPPTYPFQRKRHWLARPEASGTSPAAPKVTRAPAVAASLSYAVNWVPARPVKDLADARGRWLVLTGGSGPGALIAASVAADLERRGGVVRLAGPDTDAASLADAGWHGIVDARGLPPNSHGPLPSRHGPARPGHPDAAGPSPTGPAEPGHDDNRGGDPPGPPASDSFATEASARRDGCWSLASLLRGLRGGTGRLWLLKDEHPSAEAAFLRAAALEQPGSFGGIVHLNPADGADPATLAAAIVDSLLRQDGERDVLLRDGTRFVARLERRPLAYGRTNLSGDGVYLVTGGYGGLGLHVARWLHARGARRIALASRHGPGPEALAAIAALRAAGAEIVCETADAADPHQVAALLTRLEAHGVPLRGVVHAAGVVSTRALDGLDEDELARVLAPKLGAWTLDRLTRTRELDLFVVFSSIAAVWGSKGQAAYAAGNGFLDGVVSRRRAAGLSGLSVNWGPWRGGGMLDEASESWLAAAGVRALEPAAALAELDKLLVDGAERGVVVVVDADWDRLARLQASVGVTGLFEGLLDDQAPKPAPATSPLRTRLQAMGLADARQTLTNEIVRLVKRVLGHDDAENLDLRLGFFDLGMDSLMAVELRGRVQSLLGVELPSTMAFTFPTVSALANHLADTVLDRPAEQPAQAVPAAINEAIAVIGMGCRFPGAASPEAFWRLLENGTDAVGEVPADRWDNAALFDADPAASGKTYSRHGGFLAGIDRFDADFFGIAPREAASVDPQQRLLLEVAWEALENAGLPPPRLAGSRTGVYAGVTAADYGRMLLAAAEDGAPLDPYYVTGATLNAVAGRVSFCLGLNGPAMAVDTACSSALVAVHLACQALRAGECDLALAGGVNVILSPENTVAVSRARMLSATGHCHAFDAAADGFVRGEGAGVVVLKPLSRALADGDPVLAVIRGGAVNQDGRTSGLTVPSGPAQAALMREALARAGVSPDAVGYVEAHGTGTSLGDPIEAGALGGVFAGRDQPLRIGSVKANIGHLESAAGIAGLMKVILSLRHGTIPRQVHFHDPNPHIDWASLPLRVPVQAEAWPEGERIAGVSSFGFSGTNAHLVVSEAPPLPMAPRPPDVAGVLVLSGRGEAALRAQAEQWAAWLTGNPDADTHAVRRMAALGRAAFADRLAVVGTTAADLASGLRRFVTEGEGLTGRASGAPPKIGFLFSGQGAQWSGMGRDLYQREPMFRDVLDRCAAAVAGELDGPLLETMFAGGAALDRTDRTQPALYALSCGLAALWRSWGIEPVAVLGHSIGAFAAAHVAGVFDLETGARLVARRGRLMRDLSGDGAMVAVEASEAQVRAALAGYEALVSLAAVNGPLSCVVSGDRQAVVAVCAALPGVRQHPLTVSHAFHSPQMGPMLADFAVAFDGLALAPPTDVAFVSDSSGEVAGTEICEPTYWARHVRAPVRFADGLARMAALGCDALVEIGPRRSLLGLARQADYSGSLLASLRGPEDTGRTILESLGQLWAQGVPVAWERMFGDGEGGVTPGAAVLPSALVPTPPTYPFQRKRHWFARPADRGSSVASMNVERRAEAVSLSYAVNWVPARPVKDLADARGRWLLLTGGSGPGALIAASVAADLERRGGVVRLAGPDTDAASLADAGWHGIVDARGLPPNSHGPLPSRHGPARPGHPDATGPSPTGPAEPGHDDNRGGDPPGPPASDSFATEASARRDGCWSLASLLRGLRGGTGRLWLVKDQHPSAEAAFLRAAALEQPGSFGGIVHLDPADGADPATLAAAIVDSLLRQDGERDVLLRDGTRFVARLERRPPAYGRTNLSGDGVYLVTGGYGGLGLHVARWLHTRGARRIALASRHGPGPEALAAIAALRAAGAEIVCETADAADPHQVAALLTRLEAHGVPLRGVVHAAGVVSTRALDGLDEDELARVLAPKLGAWTLDRLTRTRDLDLFVVFSSIAAVWGSKGQAAYAAGNGFLDGVVSRRRAAGLSGLSVNWGPWRGGGMLDEASESWLAAAGVRALEPAAALAELDKLLADGTERGVVVDADWDRLARLQASVGVTGLFEGLTGAMDTPPATAAISGLLHARLEKMAPRTRLAKLIDVIETEVVTALRLEENPFATGQHGFFDAGVNSFTAIELCGRFETLLGRRLPNTLLLEHPTPDILAGHLLSLLFVTADAPAPGPREATENDDSLTFIEAAYEALLGDAAQ